MFDSFLRFRRGLKTATPTTPTAADTDTDEKKIKIKTLPAWSDPNPFILTGYRPQSNSWLVSLHSWTYTHNETANIYSHLVPAVVSLLCQGLYIQWHDNLTDILILRGQIGAAIVCLLTSALYHTFLNDSEDVARRWLLLDYGGIILLMLGNLVSGLHFGFYAQSSLKCFYWSIVSSFWLLFRVVQAK